MNLKPWHLGLALVGAYGVNRLYSLSNAGDKLETKVVWVSFKGIKQGAARFELVVQAINPTDTSLKLQNTILEVALADKEGGGGELAQLVANEEQLTDVGASVIRAANTTVLKLPVTVTLLSLGVTVLTLLVKALTGGKLPDRVRVRGRMKVSGFWIDVDEQVPFKKEIVK